MSVAGLADDAYTVSIQQFLEKNAGRAATIGTVYRALDRLDRKGFVRYAMSEVTPERGGKRKKLYRITASGKTILKHARNVRSRMWDEIERQPAWNVQ